MIKRLLALFFFIILAGGAPAEEASGVQAMMERGHAAMGTKPAAALVHFGTAQDIFLSQTNHHGLAKAYRLRGQCHDKLRQPTLARECLEQAIAHAELSTNQLEIAHANMGMGIHRLRRGQTEEGIKQLEHALQIMPDKGGGRLRIFIHIELAGKYQARGDLVHAWSLYEQGLKESQVLGLRPQIEICKLGLATLLQAVGDSEGARAFLENSRGLSIHSIVRIARNQSETLRRNGDFAEALGVTREALGGLEPIHVHSRLFLEIDVATDLFGAKQTKAAVAAMTSVLEASSAGKNETVFRQAMDRSARFLEHEPALAVFEPMLLAAGVKSPMAYLDLALKLNADLHPVQLASLLHVHGGVAQAEGETSVSLDSFSKAYSTLRDCPETAQVTALVKHTIISKHQDETEALEVGHAGEIAIFRTRANWLLGGMAVLGVLTLLGFLFAKREQGHRRRFEMQAAQLSEQTEALRETSADKGKLLQILSHDIRGPIQAASGWADMLREAGTNNPVAKECIPMIERSIARLNRMVNDISVWSLMVEDGGLLQHEVIPAQSIMDTAIDHLTDLAQLKQIELTGSASDASILSDRNGLQVVVNNILHNSIKFTPHGGTVHLSVEASGEFVDLLIQDSGSGMNAETRQRILTGQTSESQPGSEGEQGVGFGMRIVRDLIQGLGGTLMIPEGSTHGALLVVRVPAARLAQTSTPEPTA